MVTRRRIKTLPLGVDFGCRRLRVALCERRDERPRLLAVAAREVDGDPADALRAALRELGTRERRCVFGLRAPDALLSEVHFPSMSRVERMRAARFEAARHIDYALDEALVSLLPIDGRERWRLGVARRRSLAERIGWLRSARLMPVAVDDVAFALWRAQPAARSAVDIGCDATSVVVFSRPVPTVRRIPIGGDHLTEAIARSLGIDAATAEHRKQTIGFAGAGESQRDALIAAVADQLERVRAALHVDVEPVVTVGNGSRIPHLTEALERGTGLSVRAAELDPAVAGELPADVLRAAAADWTLAYGLCLWEAAA